MTDVTFDVGSSDHQLLAGDTEAALIEGSRQDPNTFLEYVLQDEETGRHIIQAPLHEEWQNLMTRHDRLVIWSATESGKSQQASIGRVLWELGRNPNLRVAIVSNTFEQAGKIVRSISKYIEQSEELHAAFPDLKPDEPWTGTQLFVKRKVRSKDPSIQAFGIHGNILGARIDVLILDDVLDYENCRTPALRADLWDWYHATLAGRLTSRARVWVIGTAFSPEDMLHRFAANPVWKAIRCPILDPSTGVSRWPERWPPPRIEERRQELGPLEFARQMLCMARDDSQSRFRRDWIDTCLIRGQGHTLVDRLDVVPKGYRVVAGVDLAVKRTAAADLSCIFTLGIHPNGSREVLMVETGRWSGPDIVSRIVDNHRRYHSIVYVEDNACFLAGTRVLTREGYRAIESIKAGDFVWTHRGRWRSVKGVLSGVSRWLTTIRAKGCLPVQATPNHWFYMMRAGRVSGRAGGQHRPVGTPQWVSCGFRDEVAYAAIAVPSWPSADPIIHLRKSTRSKAKTLIVDEELAVLLGLFMAEGHSTRGQVTWTFSKRESHLAMFVERVLHDRLGCSVAFRFGDGTLRVVASCTPLADALRIKAREHKCLPIGWMGWPLSLRTAIVRGWLMGDGCARINNGKTSWPSWMLSGVSISRDWILFVRTTLAQAGISTALRVSSRKVDTIAGREVSRRPLYELALTREGSSILRKEMRLPVEHMHWIRWWKKDRRSGGHSYKGCLVLNDSPHGWARLPVIEDEPYELGGKPVYNLIVDEDESFTVEDYIVHNAQDFIIQFAREASAVPVRPFNTGRNKMSPEFGVESLAAEMAGGKWIIPCRLDGTMHPEVAAWVHEMLYYDPAGHTGDRLMASWIAREGARKGGSKVQWGRIDLSTR